MGNTCQPESDVANELRTSSDIVRSKLLASSRYKHQFANNSKLLDELVEALSTEEGLKGKYLTTSWMKTMEICQRIEEESSKRSLKGMFQSESEALTFHSGADLEDDLVSIEDLSEYMKRIDSMYDENSSVRIKLVITEVPLNNALKNIRRLISPVISHFPTFPEYGMFHAALVVGPWYIDWNNSELCVPRKCVSNASFLSADLDEISTLASLHDTIDKLAKVITKWNTTMKYVKTSGEKGVNGNCQDFVDELLEALGIEPKFSGPLEAFLKRLKRKGVCDLRFIMDEKFRSKFQLTEERIVFDNHAQLDQFVEKLLTVDPQFSENHQEEWFLLKSFDRGFWLRHFHQEQNDRFKPYCKPCLDDEELTLQEDKTATEKSSTHHGGEDSAVDVDLACPFSDPRKTYSFRFITDSS